jgi:hypothetical protein
MISVGVWFGVTRIVLGFIGSPEHESIVMVLFKDAAHIYIGALGAAWWIQRLTWQWRLFWALNVVEVATAVITRMV